MGGEQSRAFGERLREYRRRAGFSQADLASRAGLSASGVSALERGERRRPYPHTRRALADALQLAEPERSAFLENGDEAVPPAAQRPPNAEPGVRSRKVGPVALAVAALLCAMAVLITGDDAGGPAPRRSVLLPVPYLVQQQDDWADPADLEMWLSFDHAPGLPAGEVAAQAALWTYEASHNDGFPLTEWNCSPYAVAATLDHYVGSAVAGDGVYDDSLSAGKEITRSVHALHQPVIATVDGASSYVLVVGVTLGSGGDDAAPEAVVVDDPYPSGQARDGGLSIGRETRLSWPAFVNRFTRVPAGDAGIWADHWVLIAPGLPLRG
jgi:transcriptional regulator with XRE-family HTH domain